MTIEFYVSLGFPISPVQTEPMAIIIDALHTHYIHECCQNGV